MENIRKYKTYIFAFCIPILLTGLIYFSLGIYPFGSKSILTGDLLGQYASVINYVKANITNHNWGNLFFSTSVGLGINFFPVLTYYVFSPLNLLALLFSRSTIPIFFELNIFIDIGLMSLTAYIFFSHSHFADLRGDNYVAILGSTLFALSSYVLSYEECTMWLDSIILFPLILLGYEKLISGNSGLMYYLFLTLAIISNYYIGLMIVLFLFYLSVFWLFYNSKNISVIFKNAINLMCFTLGSIGTAFFAILPSYLAQKNVQQERFSFGLEKIYPYKDIIKAFFINENSGNIPLLFCSICLPLLIVGYFLNKAFSIKQRIASGAFLIFLLISTNISALYMIWHLFTLPNGFPQRESYIINFIMITLAVKELSHINLPRLLPIITGLASFIILIVELILGNISLKILLINVLFVLIYSFLFLLWKNDYKFKAFLFTLISTECIISGVVINKVTNFADLKPFYSTNVAESSAIKKIRSYDSGIFRLGSTFQINTNDPLNYNYNGVSGYLSQLSTKQTDYLSYLGYYQKHSWFRWAQFNNGSTKALNNLLGVKYVLNGDGHINSMTRDIASYPTLNSDVALGQYKKVGQAKGISIYKNEDAFPFVFSSSYLTLRPNYNPLSNPFLNYNKIFKNFGVKKLYTPVQGANSQLILPGTNVIKGKGLQNKGLVYAYIASAKNEVLKTIRLSFNGRIIKYAGNNDNGENGIVCLGNYSKGEHIDLHVINSNSNQYKIYVYQENSKSLKKVTNFVKQESNDIKNMKFTGNSITFNTTSAFDRGYLTIPIAYQKGWSLFIDGQKQSKRLAKNFGGLVAIKAPKGSHQLSLSFRVPGLRISIIVSLLSLVGILLYDYLLVRKKTSI